MLVDLTMPGASGPRLIQRMRETQPLLRTLVVSMHDAPAVVRAALEAGADGYVTKDSDPQVLVEAVRLGEDIGSEVVLDRYARWRSVDNIGLAVAADAFVRLFSNDNPVLRAARGLGLSAVNRIGPARRFFMQEAGGAVGDLPRLLRGEAP